MNSDLEFSEFSNFQHRLPKFKPQQFSDIDRPKTTRFAAQNDFNNSILSPRVNQSELDQFNGFSNRYDHNDTDDIINDSEFMNSIELGRGHKQTHNLSNVENRNPNLDDTSSNHSLEKVTDKKYASDKRTPDKRVSSAMKQKKLASPTKDFSVPTEYKDDKSFMAELGLVQTPRKTSQPQPTRRKSNIKVKAPSSAPTSGSERLSARLPDISGLSSIFSSDEQQLGTRRRKASDNHKTVVSVPLDEDDKALFSAFSSFQSKIDKLQKDKVNLKEIINTQERELNQFRDEYTKLTEHAENVEIKAKKLKALSLNLRDNLQAERQQNNQHIQERSSILQLLKERNEEILKLQTENSDLKRELQLLRDTLPSKETPLTVAAESTPQSQPEPPQPTQPSQPSQPSQPIPQSQHEPPQPSNNDSELTALLKQVCQLLLKQTPQVEQNQPSPQPTPQPEEPAPEQIQIPDEEFEILTQVGKGINSLIELKRQKLHQTSSANAGVTPSIAHIPTKPTPKLTPKLTPTKSRLLDRCIQCEESDEEPAQPQKHTHRTHHTSTADLSWDEGPSERPSMPAEDAVKLILDKMTEELSTLKNNYNKICTEYDNTDPAVEKRRRQELANKIITSVKEVEAKSDLIYAMNDVILATNIQIDPNSNNDFDDRMGGRIGTDQWIK